MKYLILVMVCGALVTPGLAQEKAAAPVTQKPSRQSVAVTTTFDEAKNRTSVEFKQLEIAHSGPEQAFLSVAVVYSGRKLTSPPEVVFFIISVISEGGYKYPDTLQMKVSVDSANLPDVLMANLDKRSAEPGYLETIGTRMSFEVYRRLARAKSIKLQLHDLNLTLGETHIMKLRELEASLKV